jgi:hypothetical protein
LVSIASNILQNAGVYDFKRDGFRINVSHQGKGFQPKFLGVQKSSKPTPLTAADFSLRLRALILGTRRRRPILARDIPSPYAYNNARTGRLR